MIQTHLGHFIDFKNPDPESIHIEDIAHALSNMCRFTGHVRSFYSVAEHSYWCSYMVPDEHALDALLHDAHEAYVGDVASPMKAYLPDYGLIEARVQQVVRKRFGLPLFSPDTVHRADKDLCKQEARKLLPPAEWQKGLDHGLVDIQCLPPHRAYEVFVHRFNQLWKSQ